MEDYFFRYDFESKDQIRIFVTEEGEDVELVFHTNLALNNLGQLEILIKDATEEPTNQFTAIFRQTGAA